MLPQLARREPVICSRSFLSTLVYQQENWPLDWLFAIHSALPAVPDLIVILDLDPVTALERAHKRPGHSEYYERLDIQMRNRDRYLALADDKRLHDILAPRGGKVKVINAEGTPEEIHKVIWRTVEHYGK